MNETYEFLERFLGIKFLAFDEVYIPSVIEPLLMAKALRAAENTEKPFYTWSSGYTFSDSPSHAEFLSACINHCGGRGRYLFECYPYYIAEGETGLERYLDGLLDNSATLIYFRDMKPGDEDFKMAQKDRRSCRGCARIGRCVYREPSGPD